MANRVNDIIQRILVEGDAAITQTFRRIGDAGTSAFEQIGNAATKLSTPFRGFERDLTKVASAASQFGDGLGRIAQSVVTFTGRIAAAGAGVTAAGAFIFAGALKITTALRSINQGVLEQRLAATQNAAETKKHIQTDFQQANALQDLAREYQRGGLSIEQYIFQRKELTFQNERARIQQIQLEHEQEAIRKEQAKDQAAAMRRAQTVRLEAQFGSVLASTLERLAAILEQVRNKFLAAFGPAISDFLLSVANAVNTNAQSFIDMFKKMGDGLASSFGKSKLSVDGILKGLVTFGAEVVKIITAVVIPAFQLVLKILETIAQAINSIFGTNFSASTLVAAAIILKLTGLFNVFYGALVLAAGGVRLLFAAFGPVGLIVAAVVALIITQLIPALAAVDWAKLGQQAIAVWNTIVDAITNAANTVKSVWASITAFFDQQVKSIIGFFNNLIQKVKEFLNLTGSSGGSLSNDAGINDIQGKAEGGLFRGRPGRDTNLAWLTDKEFVLKPRAVKHWGVGFLNAMNALRNPFQGFNAGGLVGPMMQAAPIRRFAEGGLNRSPQRPFVLQMTDGTQFDGMTVQNDTADAMSRFATRKNIRSTGRRPAWFGGGNG